MKQRLRAATAWTAALAAALFLLWAGCAQAAPQLAGRLDQKGLAALVKESGGRPVVLNFFATWCPPCRAEIPDIAAMQRKFKGKVVVVGLSVDDDRTAGTLPAFLERMGVDYPVYRAELDLVQLFGIRSIPFNVGYDAKGKLAWAYAGVVESSEYEDMVKALMK